MSAVALQLSKPHSLSSDVAESAWKVSGATDIADARSAVIAAAPPTFNGLLIDDVDVEAWLSLYRARVLYRRVSRAATNSTAFLFEIGAQPTRLKQSKSTIASIAVSGSTPPNFNGAINVGDNGVEGVDVNLPVSTFSHTWYAPSASIDAAYKNAVASLVGTVNNAAFDGYASGEVLFMGASGSQRDGTDWEITYRFAVSKNQAGISINGLSGTLTKKGWEYLWVYYATVDDTTSKRLVQQPIAAYVEKVYDLADFSLLEIP